MTILSTSTQALQSTHTTEEIQAIVTDVQLLHESGALFRDKGFEIDLDELLIDHPELYRELT
jgi:uncharacterized Rmd1/YagE family protein